MAGKREKLTKKLIVKKILMVRKKFFANVLDP